MTSTELSMSDRISLRPSNWTWAQNISHDQAVQIDNTIWVSGQVAFDPEGNIVGGDSMRAQADHVFNNISTVLAVGGATLNDIVKITAWLTDMDRYSDYNDARAAAFPNNLPASATVMSPQLVVPGLLVEIEAIAVI